MAKVIKALSALIGAAQVEFKFDAPIKDEEVLSRNSGARVIIRGSTTNKTAHTILVRHTIQVQAEQERSNIYMRTQQQSFSKSLEEYEPRTTLGQYRRQNE